MVISSFLTSIIERFENGTKHGKIILLRKCVKINQFRFKRGTNRCNDANAKRSAAANVAGGGD